MRFTVPLPMMPADHYVPMAQAAEAAGFDSIAVPDSVFFPETVSGDYPFAEAVSGGGRPDTPVPRPVRRHPGDGGGDRADHVPHQRA